MWYTFSLFKNTGGAEFIVARRNTYHLLSIWGRPELNEQTGSPSTWAFSNLREHIAASRVQNLDKRTWTVIVNKIKTTMGDGSYMGSNKAMKTSHGAEKNTIGSSQQNEASSGTLSERVRQIKLHICKYACSILMSLEQAQLHESILSPAMQAFKKTNKLTFTHEKFWSFWMSIFPINSMHCSGCTNRNNKIFPLLWCS